MIYFNMNDYQEEIAELSAREHLDHMECISKIARHLKRQVANAVDQEMVNARLSLLEEMKRLHERLACPGAFLRSPKVA